MANNTVNEFARELKVSADTLLSQLKAAGVQVKTVNDEISDADKRQLLDSLRQERVAAPRKITVTPQSGSASFAMERALPMLRCSRRAS